MCSPGPCLALVGLLGCLPLLPRLLKPVTLQVELDDDAVVDQTVDCRGGCRRILEDLFPPGERQIARNHHTPPLVAFGQKREEDPHFLPVLLYISYVVDIQNFTATQALEHASQAEIPFGRQEFLYKCTAGGEPDASFLLDELMRDCAEQVRLATAGFPEDQYVLSLYIPKLSGKIFKASKNDDAQYLGRQMKERGWKGMAIVLVYSLMPLPTTPLFIAGGMAKLKPVYIIPPFIIGKLISDTISVLMGRYAVDNTHELVHGLVSFKSIAGVALGLSLVFVILFLDWHALLKDKRFVLKFHIWKKHAGKRASS